LYVRHNADRSTQAKNGQVHQTDRYYMKPRRVREPSGPHPQYFGNILMELTSIDGVPAHLKVMATTYSDRKFAEPKPFSDLIEVLFNE